MEPKNPDALHLLAILSKELGRLLQSLSYFDASLESVSRQPVVWSNKGNLLRSLGRLDEADKCYAKAVELMPSFKDAWQNRGALELERDDPRKAALWFETAQKLEPSLSSATSLVESYISLKEHKKAARLIIKSKKKWRGDLSILVGEARLLMSQGDHTKALKVLMASMDDQANKGFVCYQIGLVFIDQKKIEEGVFWLERALKISPDLIEAHRVLNNIFRENNDPRFLLSYAEAIASLPDFAPLYHNLSATYLSVGEIDAAGECLSKAVEEIDGNPYLVHGLGVFLMRQGRLGEAKPLLEDAITRLPDNTRFLIDLANLHMKEENYPEVGSLLAHAEQIEPYNQEIIAYLSLLWRFTDPERYAWLTQYETFVRQYDLADNSSGGSAGYLGELQARLTEMHSANREPLDQSVRNGTQTLDNLWRNKDPLVAKLKKSLDECVANYIGSLSLDPTHPFLRRVKKSYRVTGCWSVKLNNGGFHANHVHPRGWLSCCTYIALPEAVVDSDASQDGWIKFGESSLGLGARESVERAIKPVAGTCVFFPSFFWHGTNSFSSVEPRLTVPFDIDPKD